MTVCEIADKSSMDIRLSLSLLITTITVLSGCGSPSLNRSHAAELISKHSTFQEPVLFSTFVTASGSCADLVTREPGWKVMAEQHKIALRDITRRSYFTSTTCSIEPLAPWTQSAQFNSTDYSFAFPIGTRTLKDVTGIQRKDNEAVVDFIYSLILNEDGKLIYTKNHDTPGKAHFVLYDDGWRITGITTDKGLF